MADYCTSCGKIVFEARRENRSVEIKYDTRIGEYRAYRDGKYIGRINPFTFICEDCLKKVEKR